MRQSKYICGFLVLVLLVVLSNFYFKSEMLEREFDEFAKQVNTVYLERDMELAIAIQENNISKVEENLKLNLMFHLRSIEDDGLHAVLNINKTKRLCALYRKAIFVQGEMKKKFPSSAREFAKVCK